MTLDPTGVLTAVAYILPGFIAFGIRHRIAPVRRASPFVETFRSLTASLFILLPMFALESLSGYALREELPLLVAYACGVPILVGLAWGNVVRSNRWQKFLRALGVSWSPYAQVWNRVLEVGAVDRMQEPSKEVEEGEWVLVTLEEGRQYLGGVVAYGVDPDDQDPGLFLMPAYHILDKDKSRQIERGVYLQRARIVSIEFWNQKSAEESAE